MQPVWPLTFETYVKGDEETGPDQVKDNDKDKDSDKNKRNEKSLSQLSIVIITVRRQRRQKRERRQNKLASSVDAIAISEIWKH